MLFKKELEGKEIIDKDGNTIGLVEDVDISEKGRIKKVVALPTGIVSRITRKRMDIHIDDIETVSKFVLLNKTEDEVKGIYRCNKCDETFESEEKRKIHKAKEHAKKKPAKKKKTRKKTTKKKKKKK